MKLKRGTAISLVKKTALIAVSGALFGTLTSAAASEQPADTNQGPLDGVPAIYLKVCYGWLKAKYNVGVDDVPRGRLTATLESLLRRGMIGESRETSDGEYVLKQDYVASALAWAKAADRQPNCDHAPIGPLDIDEAVKKVQGDDAHRKEKQAEDAKKKYWQVHAKDPITIDYAQYSQSIAGPSARPRQPAGTVRALTVSQYQAWEDEMQSKWLHAVMGAGGDMNAMQMHDQCKADIATQWINSFGYPDAVLRTSVFSDTVLTLSSAIGSACGTQLLRFAGLPVTSDVSTTEGM